MAVNNEYVVTADPGLNIGLAMWPWKVWQRGKFLLPEAVTECKPRGKTWRQKCDYTIADMQQVLGSCIVVKAYIEFPSFMQSGGGIASARTGNLVKLVYMCGRVHQQLRNFGADVRTVKVQRWKGQLTKEATYERIIRVAARELESSRRKSRERLHALPGMRTAHSHAWDAVGIGFWAQGYFP